MHGWKHLGKKPSPYSPKRKGRSEMKHKIIAVEVDGKM